MILQVYIFIFFDKFRFPHIKFINTVFESTLLAAQQCSNTVPNRNRVALESLLVHIDHSQLSSHNKLPLKLPSEGCSMNSVRTAMNGVLSNGTFSIQKADT